MIKMNRILENYNSFKFDQVYEDINKEEYEYLNKDSFMYMTNVMYNKINLEKIYNNYYINTNKYNNKDDFIRKYPQDTRQAPRLRFSFKLPIIYTHNININETESCFKSRIVHTAREKNKSAKCSFFCLHEG